MHKKMLKILSMMVMLLFLSSCSMIPMSRLESMFKETDNSSISSGYSANNTTSSGDSNVVIISKDEYEKYQKFSEMFSI